MLRSCLLHANSAAASEHLTAHSCDGRERVKSQAAKILDEEGDLEEEERTRSTEWRV